MAHFSPVNGGYPHKDQIDRSCLVSPAAENKGIERGSIIRVNSNGEFELATDTSIAPLYFALQDYSDLQAAMAGNVGLGKGGKLVDKDNPWGKVATHIGEKAHKAVPMGQPKITGLSFQEGGNYQTDMFDHDATYKVNDPLTVKNGVFTPASGSDKVVAYVYAAPDEYYANDAKLLEGWSTGAWINVLRVSIA